MARGSAQALRVSSLETQVQLFTRPQQMDLKQPRELAQVLPTHRVPQMQTTRWRLRSPNQVVSTRLAYSENGSAFCLGRGYC